MILVLSWLVGQGAQNVRAPTKMACCLSHDLNARGKRNTPQPPEVIFLIPSTLDSPENPLEIWFKLGRSELATFRESSRPHVVPLSTSRIHLLHLDSSLLPAIVCTNCGSAKLVFQVSPLVMEPLWGSHV